MSTKTRQDAIDDGRYAHHADETVERFHPPRAECERVIREARAQEDEDDEGEDDEPDALSVTQAARELALWVVRAGLLERARADGYGESDELARWLRQQERAS